MRAQLVQASDCDRFFSTISPRTYFEGSGRPATMTRPKRRAAIRADTARDCKQVVVSGRGQNAEGFSEHFTRCSAGNTQGTRKGAATMLVGARPRARPPAAQAQPVVVAGGAWPPTTQLVELMTGQSCTMSFAKGLQAGARDPLARRPSGGFNDGLLGWGLCNLRHLNPAKPRKKKDPARGSRPRRRRAPPTC